MLDHTYFVCMNEMMVRLYIFVWMDVEVEDFFSASGSLAVRTHVLHCSWEKEANWHVYILYVLKVKFISRIYCVSLLIPELILTNNNVTYPQDK